jgi:hypothetical protein
VQGEDTNTGVFFPAADTVAVATGGSERLRVDSSGNVGINTTSPLRTLDVAASGSSQIAVRSTSTGEVAVRLQNSTTGTGDGDGIYLGRTSSINYLWTYENEPWVFATNNTECARFDTSGKLLLGTTANPNSASLNVLADGASAAVSVQVPSTSSYTNVFFRNPNGNVGSITTSGTSTSYATSSDYRLKENVQPMQDALSVIAQLNPVTYTWKADGSDGQGFIAHELQAVVPDCVTGEKDAVDAEGNPKYQGVDTSFLVGILTKAIQEQQALITALTARVAALEA